MKMRHTVIHATAIAFALAALPVLAQNTTETTTTTTTVRKHDYVYYGDHDIYFAPETKTYFWREGNDWRSGLELPPESRAYITRGGVKIQLDTERPYERNEWVIEHYKHHDHDDDD
jgi:hypothetical protein